MERTLLELIRSRRSIRRFTPEAVGEEELAPLLEAMRWAPSGGSVQPYRAQVVLDEALRRRLSAAALGQPLVAEAPVALVFCVELEEAERAYGRRGVELYALQDVAAAVQNVLLAAHAAGLGACWVGAFREDEVAEVLELPRSERPVAIVPLGHPAEAPLPPRRRPLAELVRYHDRTK